MTLACLSRDAHCNRILGIMSNYESWSAQAVRMSDVPKL